MTTSKSALDSIARAVRDDFERHRPIMSFTQFLDVFIEQPRCFARNSAQYVRDCLQYFGESTRAAAWGDVTRYNLFDAPFDGGRNRLIGQELAQLRVMRLIDGFAREGRVNKLILLHGPNGSAKSTFVATLLRALEVYSQTDDGALYRFNWIFPNQKHAAGGSTIGFGGFSTQSAETLNLDTFAFLDEDQIDAKIRSDLNDHPLLLIPRAQREQLLRDHIEESANGTSSFVLSDYITRGELSHASRQIFDALMSAYRGDLNNVLKHIQVERFYVSRRYRVGAVTVEPQMRVDAALRQLTVDRSLGALPSSLQNQTLFEPFGDLVDANRGVIEYDDLFKRPPELNKYLLATSEKGTVSLDNRILHLDTLLVATANEDYLDAYKQMPDYASFKGRVEFVRVPYILDYVLEQTIYEDQLAGLRQVQHVAPHTSFVAALWAVLTRLRRPKPDSYDKQVRDVIGRLTPLEKAELYAHGEVPEHVPADRAALVRSLVEDLMTESDVSSEYEGRRGASPREMKMILLAASQNGHSTHLSPLAVFAELHELVRDPSVFPFLQIKPDGEYHRYDQFIDTVCDRYLDIVDEEVKDAMGLVDASQYDDLFARYVDHVSQAMKGEKVYNRALGTYERPDEQFMAETEELLGADDGADFRQGIISTIAAFSIDNPGVKVEYPRVFPNLFARMRRSFFEERDRTVRKILTQLIEYFDDRKASLAAADLQTVEATLDALCSRYGYTAESVREAVAFLLSNRYKD